MFRTRASLFTKLKALFLHKHLHAALLQTYKQVPMLINVNVYINFITSLPVNLQGSNAGASSLYLAGSFPKWYSAKSINLLWDTPGGVGGGGYLTKCTKIIWERSYKCVSLFTSSCSQNDPWPLVVSCNVLHKICSVYSSVKHTSHAQLLILSSLKASKDVWIKSSQLYSPL